MWTAEDHARMCWQRGGATLLGDLIGAVARQLAESKTTQFAVLQPDAPREMPSPADPRFHHSFAMWSPYESGVWRVKQFLGLDRRVQSAENEWLRAPGDGTEADVVVIDDAGLGYRDLEEVWPRVLQSDAARWIVLKTASPVAHGPLWEALLDKHASRLIVVMNVDDLRRTEVQISRQLSWERTAQDVLWELTHNPRVNGLSRCAHAIVSFGTSGAIHLSLGREPSSSASLFIEPAVMEADWEDPRRGSMIGFTVTLTAALVRELMANIEAPNLSHGIQSGIAGMRRLYKDGYASVGEFEVAFPTAKIIEEITVARPTLTQIEIQNPSRFLPDRPDDVDRPAQSGFWTILEDRYSDQLNRIAERIVVDGVDAALTDVPRGKIGALMTVDRHEIESLRSIQNLMGEYCRHKQKRPLSIAVFGPPGSGKSFGVEQVANTVSSGEIKSLTFNLSQFSRPEELYGSLHQVRDVGLSGQIPLVFWDEFDSALGRQPLGWLRYFLAPMQDGSFQQGEITHPIGRCIFVFAGGTSARFEEFGSNLTDDERTAAKVPDFISRLKGYLNVLGPNPQPRGGWNDSFFVIRRALLLRSLFERGAPGLFERTDGRKRLRIDQGVLRAFLHTQEFKHGIRSMESLVAMSTLSGKTTFERSSLPPQSQLEIHVDGLDFLALVQEIVLTDELSEKLAEAAHDVFRDGKCRDGWTWGPVKDEAQRTHPLLVAYSQLPDESKEANRVTVRAIPQKLAIAGYVMLPARSNERPLEFPGDDLEKLAEFEHQTWMNAKLVAGYTCGKPTAASPRQNEYLVPWDQVPEAIKQIDRDLVRGIPRILEKAGYAVVKARAE